MSKREEYTPTTDEVRETYERARYYLDDMPEEGDSYRAGGGEFDAWLAAHDREIREQIAEVKGVVDFNPEHDDTPPLEDFLDWVDTPGNRFDVGVEHWMNACYAAVERLAIMEGALNGKVLRNLADVAALPEGTVIIDRTRLVLLSVGRASQWRVPGRPGLFDSSRIETPVVVLYSPVNE